MGVEGDGDHCTLELAVPSWDCATGVEHAPFLVFYDGEGVEDRKDDYEGSAECVSHYERIIGNFSDTVLSCFGDEDGKDGSECDVALSQVVSENSLSRRKGLVVKSILIVIVVMVVVFICCACLFVAREPLMSCYRRRKTKWELRKLRRWQADRNNGVAADQEARDGEVYAAMQAERRAKGKGKPGGGAPRSASSSTSSLAAGGGKYSTSGESSSSVTESPSF